jgi:hypothetical protein
MNLEKATDQAIAKENKRYLDELEKAGPGACPNCLKTGGGHCWCCSPEIIEQELDALNRTEGVRHVRGHGINE